MPQRQSLSGNVSFVGRRRWLFITRFGADFAGAKCECRRRPKVLLDAKSAAFRINRLYFAQIRFQLS